VCVCVCVCVYLYVYVCGYIMYVKIPRKGRGKSSIDIHTFVCVRVWACVCVCICIYMYMYVYIDIFLYENTEKRARQHLNGYPHVCLCACACVCVCVCMCIYIHSYVCVHRYILTWKYRENGEAKARLISTLDWKLSDAVKCVRVYIKYVCTRVYVLTHFIPLMRSGEDTEDSLRCTSLSAKEPLIIEPFCGKWLIKTKYPLHLRHPVAFKYLHLYMWLFWCYTLCVLTCHMCVCATYPIRLCRPIASIFRYLYLCM